ncbi:MAG: DUF4139 domain-containing protein [Deltaproteobacteria bacterium]|nr:DUF4139 domain-containing protein [Deltaproteobacteria bacterium]
MFARFLVILSAVLAVLPISMDAFAVSPDEPASTSEEQRQIALTIYNEDLGLVKDVRRVKLKQGPFLMEFLDVAEKMDPTSVFLKSLTHPGQLSVLEQNYEFDLITPQRLLEKSVGRKVILVDRIKETGVEQRTEATLLSVQSGTVYQVGEEIDMNPPGRPVLPSLPDGLHSQPTLVWLLENRGEKHQTIEVSYLTRGISWKADYVAVIDQEDRSMDLTCWVTIRNESGSSYKDARIKLIAGDVHQETEAPPRRVMMAMAEDKAAPEFKETPFFEYHLYTLDRPSTIKDSQIKQMTLLSATGTPVKKEYFYRAPRGFWGEKLADTQKDKAQVELVFRNDQKSRLGVPLPKGKLRIYKADTDQTLQFIGEDSLDHTPKDEDVRVRVGKAFDVVVERSQTNFSRLSPTVLEESYEIRVSNHKNDAVTIFVEENLEGDWQITKSSRDWVKKDAFTIRFEVRVQPGQVETVSYSSVSKR